MGLIGAVYLIRNKVNNKVYIGQTIQSLKDRWIQHCNDVSNETTRCLQNAIKKYGKEAFTIETLVIRNSVSALTKEEKIYISLYKSYPPSLGYGYNMTPGGYGGGHYQPHTEEAKQKMSLGNLGKRRTPEQLIRWSSCKKGKSTKAWAHKVSATLKAKGIRPPGGKKGTKQSFRSIEHRQKISMANTRTLLVSGGFYGS